MTKRVVELEARDLLSSIEQYAQGDDGHNGHDPAENDPHPTIVPLHCESVSAWVRVQPENPAPELAELEIRRLVRNA
jgi:hypothetical protein